MANQLSLRIQAQQHNNLRLHPQAGFTLIEVMITMVIAMTILAGLVLNFISQSAQYSFQDKRVDAAQDLEFTLRFMADDLQNILVLTSDLTTASYITSDAAGTRIASFDGNGISPSTYLRFNVWDSSIAIDNTKRVERFYSYNSPELKYDRENSTSSAQAILGEPSNNLKGLSVTHFRIFQDNLSTRPTYNGTANSGYKDLPPPLPLRTLYDATGSAFDMPGITILIEVEIDALYAGSMSDVLGNSVSSGKRRLWRYIQVYPNTMVTQ